METMKFETIIAGGGFAGVYAARALTRKLDRNSRSRVALIADHNFITFQPMLAEVAGSSLSPRHVVTPLRQLCRHATVLRAKIENINLETKELEMTAGHYTPNIRIRFDHIALALGSIVNLSRVPGMPEHAYVMKNVGDAHALRSAILDRLEEANIQTDAEAIRHLLTFVVVGGGYSGVETAGQINDLIGGVEYLYPRLREYGYKVILVHSRDHLLPEVSESLGIYCQDHLRLRGIEVLLNQRVKSMTASKVFLSDGTMIHSHTVVSTVGNAPHPLITTLFDRGELVCSHGRIKVGADLLVEGKKDVWAAGDCAVVPKSNGGNCPPTAQFALRQGQLLGENIAAVLGGGKTKRFTFTGLGELASIGHRAAVAQIGGMRFSGLLAWFMWRTIYLSKLPGLERKVRVLIDWTLDLFFSRDITLLEPKPTEVLQEVHLAFGDFVFHAGDPALSFYIIKSGRIELRDKDGVVKTMSGGEHFGERALLHDKIWRFDAFAVEPTTLVSIDGATFEAISRASQSIHEFFRRSSSKYSDRKEIAQLLEALPEQVRKMKVQQLMSSHPVTMRPSMTLAEALQLMTKEPFNSFPLIDDNGNIISLVGQGQVYEALKSGSIDPQTQLDKIPRVNFTSVTPETPASEALEQFIRSGHQKLLVVDHDQKLRGILTPIDLLSRKEVVLDS